MKEKGYTNSVNFIMVHRDISLKACIMRADIMNSNNHIIRRIPESFHNFACDTLPESCSKIYETGYIKDKTIDFFHLIDRNNQIIWTQNQDTEPGSIFYEWLNDPNHSIEFMNHEEYANRAYENESHGFGAK